MLSDTKLLMEQFPLEWNRNSREFRGAYLPIRNDENRHLGTPHYLIERTWICWRRCFTPRPMGTVFQLFKMQVNDDKVEDKVIPTDRTMFSFSSAKFWPLKTCQRNCAKRVNSMTWSEDVSGVNHFIICYIFTLMSRGWIYWCKCLIYIYIYLLIDILTKHA